MGIFKRIFGICNTQPPKDPVSWKHSEGTIEIDLGLMPELAEPGGAVRLEGNGLDMRVLIVHGLDGKFHAFGNRCTHTGHRRIDPLPGEEAVRCCSVSKSTYDYDGNVISGAAKEPIPVFQVEEEGGRMRVQLS